MIEVEDAIRSACVYCLRNRLMASDQILLRGDHVYLCAPSGQLIEGYLVIASYDCVGAVSLLGDQARAEIAQLADVVAEFYRTFYGESRPIFYEQGRGGGGERCDATHRFPYHAHFCGLPVRLDAHANLAARFFGKPVATLQDLATVAAHVPYVYVDGVTDVGESQRIVYLPESPIDVTEMEALRLKPVLADLLGIPERADWRSYPGAAELAQVIQKFGRYRRERGDPGG